MNEIRFGGGMPRAGRGDLMAKRDYSGDYELEHNVDSRGNLKTSAR